MSWNAQGITRKKHEVFDVLLKESVDIGCFNESFLKAGASFSHPDFITYRLDREGRRGGGVAISIRSHLPHKVLPLIDTKIVECISISLPTSGGTIQLIGAYYPGSTKKEDLSDFRDDLGKLMSTTSSCIIVGDLNCRHTFWNCARANQAGNILLNEIISSNFSVHHSDSYTHFPHSANRNPSVIDLVLSNNINPITQPSTKNLLDSDHLPLFFEIISPGNTYLDPRKIRCYAKADWSLFREFLNDRLPSIPDLGEIVNSTQIDHLVSSLENCIHEAENVAVPLISPVPFSFKLSDEIQELIKLRNCKRRQWQRRRSKTLKVELNQMSRHIKSLTTESYNNQFQDFLATLPPGHKNFWSFSRIIKNKSKSIPVLVSNGQKLFTSSEKSNCIAEKFAKAHLTTFNDHTSPEIEKSVQDCFSKLNEQDIQFDSIRFTEVNEISRIIKSLKRKKAPGRDKINNLLLKNLNKKAIHLLATIYNGCLKLGYFPDTWKHAIVVPILKPKKVPSSPDSYRPISLLSSLSKVFEKVLLSRINDHLNSRPIIKDEQFGFRPKLSTSHLLKRVTTDVRDSLESKKSTGLLLMDVERAFDSVWHLGLIFKLNLFGFPLYISKIIISFLGSRSFQVLINSELSQVHNVPAGVPQGSCLSPTLYSIYCSDFSPSSCKFALFADDTSFFSSGLLPDEIIADLQKAVDEFLDYCKKWKIKINSAKTESIYFTRRRARRFLPQQGIMVGSDEIPWSVDVKYLGMKLDTKLTYKKHTDYAISKCEDLIKVLYPLIGRKSKLSLRNKLILYKVAFRSVLSYASPCWKNCAATHRSKLQLFQNKCLKIIYDLPRYFSTSSLHNIDNIEYLQDYLDRIQVRFDSNLEFIDNCFIDDMRNT